MPRTAADFIMKSASLSWTISRLRKLHIPESKIIFSLCQEVTSGFSLEYLVAEEHLNCTESES